MWESAFIDFQIYTTCFVRHRVLCGGLDQSVFPAVFELDWTGVVQRRVHAFPVIPEQPAKHRILGLADLSKRSSCSRSTFNDPKSVSVTALSQPHETLVCRLEIAPALRLR